MSTLNTMSYYEKYLKYKTKYLKLNYTPPLQKGGVGEIYELINIDNKNDIVEISGELILKFNTHETSTLHETILSMYSNEHYRATPNYPVPGTSLWYQLCKIKNVIYQLNNNGERIRRVQLKPTKLNDEHTKLNDEEIRNLIKVPVHSGDGDEMTSKWKSNLLLALETGATNVTDINRVIAMPSHYLGGRWLHAHLEKFKELYPQYKNLNPPRK